LHPVSRAAAFSIQQGSRSPFKAIEAITQVVEAITSVGYHAQMAASFSAAAAESAKKAAILAEMAEEHSRLAVEMAMPPKAAEPVGPVEPAKPAEPAEAVEPAEPVEAAEPAKPVEPAPKRQRTCTNCSYPELRAEEVEVLKQADEQADEPHDAGAWDRYLEAGMEEHFGVEKSPSPLPLDSPLDSPDW